LNPQIAVILTVNIVPIHQSFQWSATRIDNGLILLIGSLLTDKSNNEQSRKELEEFVDFFQK
jgi:hypothetical protein